MNDTCTNVHQGRVCGAKLEGNGYCPKCDQMQLEFKIDFSREVDPDLVQRRHAHEVDEEEQRAQESQTAIVLAVEKQKVVARPRYAGPAIEELRDVDGYEFGG